MTPRNRNRSSLACRALGTYFNADWSAVSEPRTAVCGMDFQRLAWSALRRMRVGDTMSYGEVATRIGWLGAARAVGLANGPNAISFVVPRHRVIGADGSLTGFGGGIERRRWLLAHKRGAGLRS